MMKTLKIALLMKIKNQMLQWVIQNELRRNELNKLYTHAIKVNKVLEVCTE